MSKSILRLSREGTVLAVVDIQERLLPAMLDKDRLVRKSVQLIQGCHALGVPVLGTEQYPRGLGRTIPEVAQAIPSFQPLEKTSFSSLGAPGFPEALRKNSTSNVILCGIECHVCVAQTCLDLLSNGLNVFVVADAVSSRALQDCQIGIERMRDAGASIVSVEMALFELLGGADKPEFRQILGIVK